MLLLLTLLAPVAVLASEMPRTPAWLLVAAAVTHGLQLSRREWRRPRRSLMFTGDGLLLIDGEIAVEVGLQWRGPLAFLSWRDPSGRQRRLTWWPDTLPPRRRRELRLAAGQLSAAPPGPSVAP